MYEHVFVEAPTAEAAFRKALDDIEQPWENVQADYESSRATTIERAVELPTSIDIRAFSLAHLLYDAGLETLPIPDDLTEDNVDEVGFV